LHSSGTELRRYKAHQGSVLALAISPDGKTLAWATNDNTIRLWEVATAQEVRTLTGYRGTVCSIAFAPDGKSLASASHETSLLIWDVPARVAKSGDALAARELEAFWADLAGTDAAKAYRAISALAAAPKSALPFLGQQLPKPIPKPEPQRLARLIADLDSDEFAPRQQATEELDKLGELAESAMRKELNGKLPSLELRRRLEQLLEKLTVQTPEQLRWPRAIQAVEWMDTTEATPLLEALAKDAPSRVVRQDATAALERLAQRAAMTPATGETSNCGTCP